MKYDNSKILTISPIQLSFKRGFYNLRTRPIVQNGPGFYNLGPNLKFKMDLFINSGLELAQNGSSFHYLQSRPQSLKRIQFL